MGNLPNHCIPSDKGAKQYSTYFLKMFLLPVYSQVGLASFTWITQVSWHSSSIAVPLGMICESVVQSESGPKWSRVQSDRRRHGELPWPCSCEMVGRDHLLHMFSAALGFAFLSARCCAELFMVATFMVWLDATFLRSGTVSYLDPYTTDSNIQPLALILVWYFWGRKSVVLFPVELGEPQRFVVVRPGSHNQHMDHVFRRILGGHQFRHQLRSSATVEL